MTDPIDLLQQLIRIDTTNPPGNEAAAISLIQDVIESAGITTNLLSKDPARPNLIAKIPGAAVAPPFLMQGHVDVVPTTGQQWAHDPFGGDIIDGYLWGRGTLDMKGAVVMMVDAFLRLAASDEPPAGDVILCVLADEEMHGTFGARFLVEERPDVFDGVQYCIGEFGGFSFRLGGRTFYPIQIAERVGVKFELTVRGPAGHGSMPTRGGTTARLGRLLTTLDRKRMPIHIVPATRMMLEGIADHTEGTTRRAVQSLLNPRTAGTTLKVLHKQLGVMEPLLRNTVSATVIQGGDKHNVIPAEIRVTLDGRMLPGLDASEMAAELQAMIGPDIEIAYEVDGKPVPAKPDMGLFPLLADTLRRLDPAGIPIPFMMPAVTDGRWFAQLGIQPYGFTPMTLPEGFNFQSTVHAADERIPVQAISNGADAIYQLLTRYAG